MTAKKNSNSGPGDYRSRQGLHTMAEKKAGEMGRMDLNGLSHNDIKDAIHDLRVNQIEEEGLKKSEVKYAELVERAYDGVVIVQDEVFKFVNPSWCQITGFSADDIMGRSFTDVIPDDYKEFVSQRHKARLAGENPPAVYEGRILCKDGSVKDIEVSASIIEYEGRAANMALVRDISERRQMENVLTFMAQRSVTGTGGEFFESIAPYLASNLSMDFVSIYRLDAEGVYAKNVAMYCDGRFKDNMLYALKDTACGDVVGKEVCCFPSGARQSFPKDQILKELQAESYVGVPLLAHTGKPIGIIAAIGRRPLTNTRAVENMLKIVGVRAASELERLDSEGRRARLEGELRQAYKMQAIGTLAGGIAHEFNNILAIILGNTEMAILDSPGLNQTRDYLKEIERASIRGRDVVKQLLSFSRIGQVKRIAIKPDKIFSDSLRLIRASIPTSIELRQNIETNIYTILADSTQLNQVIINLCTNARDAMRSRGGVLEVTTKPPSTISRGVL
ncbi:hypothetical protein PITCH_A720095 [uncultured Desulfobacterium sp.]|uniref:histidine kinase n=1 Tax=uncultured Desulfobacterium sp. TaxID=201089 RepID=A0A445N224_9BACT|nr:hypothetical protein PITCH_A720095 [uncultured Desulfobacterium sp.]